MTSAAIYARVSRPGRRRTRRSARRPPPCASTPSSSGLTSRKSGSSKTRATPGPRWSAPPWRRCGTWSPRAASTWCWCYSPDRLARKFAYQALLIEEFARAGVRVEFVKGPRGDTPEDQLLVQFQGMFAEYEKAQLMERYRRGKAHRAKTGSSTCSVAPRSATATSARPNPAPPTRSSSTRPCWWRRCSAATPTTAPPSPTWPAGSPTRAHPPAPARTGGTAAWSGACCATPPTPGRAVFGKTMVIHEPPGLNRVARLQGRTVPRAVKTAGPAPGGMDWHPASRPSSTRTPSTGSQQRLADNKRFASRNTKVPSLLQGLAACSSCGYGYYRTTTTTSAGNKIYYYRCLGSDDYRYEGGRVCDNKPVRADYLDTVGLGPRHRPARRPGTDPRRDQQTARAGPHRRPGRPAAPAAGTGPGQGRHRRSPP